MPADDPQHLRPATPEEIAETLSFALRYEGRRRVHHADDAMARITAERLVEHLERSGFEATAPQGTIRPGRVILLRKGKNSPSCRRSRGTEVQHFGPSSVQARW